MRIQPKPPLQPPLPAGFLLRGRQQRNPFFRSHRRLQIQVQERGQDPTLFRDPGLLGNSKEENQDFM